MLEQLSHLTWPGVIGLVAIVVGLSYVVGMFFKLMGGRFDKE